MNNELKQYHSFTLMKVQLEIRLKILRDRVAKRIKTEGIKIDQKTWRLEEDGVVGEVKLRQANLRVDEIVLETLLRNKGYWSEVKKEVPDHDLVEQLFIEEKLTDDDLRAIGVTKDPIMAISIREIDV